MTAPRVTIWNEFRHEKTNPAVAALYPEGMHATLAQALRGQGLEVRTAVLDEPEHGLGEAVLAATDTLIWWGHKAHEEVDDAVVVRVQDAVWRGMGLVVLHSAHYSKIFRRLLGTPCTLNWRDDGELERLWVTAPEHPIAAGIAPCIELQKEEMYGEVFEIPTPDEVVFVSWFEGGEVFRSGCTWTRGRGRIFYFRPGHETFPTYHDASIQRVITNACHWAAPTLPGRRPILNRRQDAIEPIG